MSLGDTVFYTSSSGQDFAGLISYEYSTEIFGEDYEGVVDLVVFGNYDGSASPVVRLLAIHKASGDAPEPNRWRPRPESPPATPESTPPVNDARVDYLRYAHEPVPGATGPVA